MSQTTTFRPLPDEERPFVAPGVVEPGWHVVFLPEFRPGPRARYCHAGVIVSVGPKCVRWRPLGWHKDLRTPLEHMRISGVHIPAEALVRNTVERRPCPVWYRWSLAEHLAYAAQQSAAQAARTRTYIARVGAELTARGAAAAARLAQEKSALVAGVQLDLVPAAAAQLSAPDPAAHRQTLASPAASRRTCSPAPPA